MTDLTTLMSILVAEMKKRNFMQCKGRHLKLACFTLNALRKSMKLGGISYETKERHMYACCLFLFTETGSFDYNNSKMEVSLSLAKGEVIFKAGYRGGRIFGGVPNYFASSNWGIKILAKITKYMMGCEIFGIYV